MIRVEHAYRRDDANRSGNDTRNGSRLAHDTTTRADGGQADSARAVSPSPRTAASDGSMLTQPCVLTQNALLPRSGLLPSGLVPSGLVPSGRSRAAVRGLGLDDESSSAVNKLLLRYRRRRDTRLRDQLVEAVRPTVEVMARRMSSRLPPCVDIHDLVHAGVWGLMQAIDKFDPERCEQFATFARIRVRGAMLDELRNMDFLPRLYRRRQRDREQALLRLRSELLREPSDAELAHELGVTLVTLQRSYVRRGEQQMMGRETDDENGSWDAMDLLADEDVESPIESISQKELVANIQASLAPIEWKVLQLHYLEGMSGKAVARRLRLSASRICQIHGRVLERLKQRLCEREETRAAQ
jgi:RNA polymerase sigma factor for flagellar operon FliA